MTEVRRPLHLATFLGVSAAAYAVSLAIVTALQAQTEAVVMSDRAPSAQSIAHLSASNDRLESRARQAAVVYQRATDAYDRVGQALTDVESQLARLADVVGTVNGAALALPDRVALPRVTRSVTPIGQPTVHAVTAASGG